MDDSHDTSGEETQLDPVQDFREQALIRHNLLRSKHQKTGPLTLDEDLCRDATEWANYLSKHRRKLEHCSPASEASFSNTIISIDVLKIPEIKNYQKRNDAGENLHLFQAEKGDKARI